MAGTSEAHLQTHWKLLAAGQVVSDAPRHEMLRDTMNRWAHHRAQMTVYDLYSMLANRVLFEGRPYKFVNAKTDGTFIVRKDW